MAAEEYVHPRCKLCNKRMPDDEIGRMGRKKEFCCRGHASTWNKRLKLGITTPWKPYRER